jgi:hypothetical protein
MPHGGSRESSAPLIVTAIVLAAGVGGFFWWQKQQKPAEPPPPPVILPAQPQDAAPPPPSVPDAAPAPVSQPLPGVPRGQLPPLDEADSHVAKLLNGLLGRKNVLSFLFLDGAVRRFVATVDNLANEQAPARLWPVKPTPGNFTVEPRDGAPGAANARRYAAFVRFAEGVDSRRAVAVYVHLYPLFQQAYEELGYDGKAFHDRVVQVIDHLLATPDLSDPARVRLVEAKGATRPLYQFFDTALESRSAGQKVLLRVGPENAARLKAKLTELRRELTSSPAARKKKRR